MDAEGRQGFSGEERVGTSRDFRRCIREGGRAEGQFVVVYLARNGLGLTRLGAGSSRRVGGAVERNRAKRKVREAFRQSKRELPPNADLVRTAMRAADNLGSRRASRNGEWE